MAGNCWFVYEDEMDLVRADSVGNASTLGGTSGKVFRLGWMRARDSSSDFWGEGRAALSYDGKYVIFAGAMAYPAGNCSDPSDLGCDDVYLLGPLWSGSSAPAVSLSPTSLAFGNQTVGTTSGQQIVTLTNTGSASLTISSIALTAGTQFALTAPSSGSDCRTIGTVAASGTCNIAVTFTPTTTGAQSDTVSINDSASGSPQTFGVSGTGVTATITAVSGSGQTAAAGTNFPNPLVVSVTSGGSPISGETVTFAGAGVTFPSGDTAVTNSGGQAQVTAQPTTNGAITITASVAGISTPASFSETGTTDSVLKSITLDGTGPGTTVHLKAKATSPVVVTLSSSNPSVVTAPATVIVPTGSSSAETGTLLGSLWAPADSGQTATLTAALNGVQEPLTATFYSPSLNSFACKPTTCPAVVGGQPYNVTVELSGTAPVGGGTVQFTSDNPAVIPSQTAIVPAGQNVPTTSPIPLNTNAVTATTTVTVTATFNGTQISAGPITVNPAVEVKSVVSDGDSSPGTAVILTAAAPTGGVVVQITSSDQSIAYAPATVTVPAGQASADIGTLLGSAFTPAGSSQSATISATYNSITKSLTKSYTSPTVSTFGCTTTPCPSVTGGQTISFNLALSKSAAPVGGATVTISSDTPSVVPTQTVTIAAGQNSPATIPVLVNTNTVTANTKVTVSASYNGSTKNAAGGAITVTP
jgi:hypothetical protein